MAKAKTTRTNSNKTNGEAVTPSVSPVNPVNPSVSPEPVAEFRKAPLETRKNIVPINLEDEIRRRAYELWEQHGCVDGQENEHWLLAEREVRERYQRQHQQSA